ncbi:ATP-binding protein [Pseudomonas fulva]|uniref:ATP-dependent nuclease n=1 Tax=Pseudomonas fulva TaxID=47880 RepID=UPI0024475544|nr:ATP-binding protein [Pseudomonas fulva]MDH1308329.1 ATP-binding protein [Pseudomonas fulva]
MIRKLEFKFGRSPESPSQVIGITPVTVFVGPNNSGKSLILREIESYCRTGEGINQFKVVGNIEFIEADAEKAKDLVKRVEQPLHANEVLQPGNTLIGVRHSRFQVPKEMLLQALQSPCTQPSVFTNWYLSHFTLMLDGPNRIRLISEQQAGDLQQPPTSSLQVLLRSDSKRHEVRRIVYDAFGRYFVIDPTHLGLLRIRLSERVPVNDMEERGIHAEAVAFHAAAQPIEEASEGVKAFTGIITEVMAGDPSIVLVDEPEAFLHPPLASKLGQEVARAALSTDKRVFVSTHSPQFVMGCIQSGAPVNIVRLTYRGGIATARVLPSNELLDLMRHPLLRSTGVLSGLFYEFIVVTESDADRAFYQEINERLLQLKPEWGIPNCLFINAQNKQTVQTLLKPLRKLGIPAAGVVDIDVLKEGGTNWANLLSSADVPPLSHNSLASMRAAVKSAMDATGKDMKRQGGLAILEGADKQASEDLLEQLKQYGIFVVPNGELESWMAHLGARGHGPMWLVDIFERMGANPSSDNYVKPGDDDAWAFVNEIRKWLMEPKRKGIPA